MVAERLAKSSCRNAVQVRFLYAPLWNRIPPVEEVSELDSRQ